MWYLDCNIKCQIKTAGVNWVWFRISAWCAISVITCFYALVIWEFPHCDFWGHYFNFLSPCAPCLLQASGIVVATWHTYNALLHSLVKCTHWGYTYNIVFVKYTEFATEKMLSTIKCNIVGSWIFYLVFQNKLIKFVLFLFYKFKK